MKKQESYKNLPLQKISEVVENIYQRLQPGSVLLLQGEVGSGKTEFLKHLMKKYGVNEIASPTFSLHHSYAGKNSFQFTHVDLYRVKSMDDLESTGFWDLFQNSKGILLIEWSDLISDSAWPMDWKKIRLKIEKNSQDRSYFIQEWS